jgi:hypothetical protein
VPDDIMQYHFVLAISIYHNRKAKFKICANVSSRDIEGSKFIRKKRFFVDICLCDNKFEGVRASLQNHRIKLIICAPNEHVPEVERKIRTVKEQVQGLIPNLPFNTLPPAIIVHAVVFSVLWLNNFPPKVGISKTILPQAIVTGMSSDAEKHCQIPFGAYA